MSAARRRNVKCCHCGDPIERTADAHPEWPEGLHPWLHVETQVPDCKPMLATPRYEMVITNGPPRERVVYVPIDRGGRGGTWRRA